MNADRDPAVVGDGLEPQIAVGLIGEPDLGFQISGEEAEAAPGWSDPDPERSCR